MPRPPARFPTELELEILKILWREGPLSVRQVREALAPRRSLAHTSVMTMLGIMTDKGYLRRKSSSGGFIYSPRVTEQKTLRRMLADLVDRAFEGSALSAMLHLLDTRDLREDEIRMLRKLLDEKT